MAYYGEYQRVGDYDYPPGAYVVMSWWGYGHWITQRGERIPNANPFQQGAVEAANFLLAPNETRANEILAEEVSEDDAQTRYVMIDWKMVDTWPQSNGKFFAPIVFYEDANVNSRDFYEPTITQTQGGAARAYYLRSQRYYESMVNRLWYFHGSARDPSPLVINYDERTVGEGQQIKTPPAGDDEAFRWFGRTGSDQALDQARQFVEEDGTAQIGGIGPHPPERVEALEHYRLVHRANSSALQRGSPYVRGFSQERNGLLSGVNQNELSDEEQQRLRAQLESIFFPRGVAPPWVKVFERVPGATIEGTGPANTNVTATVQMQAENGNSTFFYEQRARTDENGEFTMTVPYSTTGYDEWGSEDGYTDVDVTANTQYQFSTPTVSNESALYQYTASADVTEGQVIGEDDSPVTVELERQRVADLSGGEDGSGTDGSGDNNTSSEQSSVAGPATLNPAGST